MDSSVVGRHTELIDTITIGQRLNPNQKINQTAVVVTETQEPSELIETQYINMHRLTENLQKVQLVGDQLTNDLLSQQVVELASSNDFIAPVSGQYYEDEFLPHDLTEEDRRLAAALVAVQLVQQQKHSLHNHTLLTPEMLKHSLPPLAPMPSIAADKQQPVTTTMVTSYLQGFDEDEDPVPQQLMDTTQNPDRLLKMYQSQTLTSANLNVATSPSQSLNDIRLPALPPLKKVLSNPSILRNRYDRSLEETQNLLYDKDLLLKSPSKDGPKQELIGDVNGEVGEIECDSDFEGENNLKSSKRSLPHKKRIPRKLKSQQSRTNTKYKCQKCGEAFANQAALVSHRANHQVPAKRTSVFSCEICGFHNNNQIRFFEHLKGHYEPSMIQVTDVLQQEGTFIDYDASSNSNPLIQDAFTIKEVPEQASASNFTCNQCNRTFRRQKTYETHLATAHPAIEEFSEPEDMMEGIRHVVNIQTASDEKDETIRNWRLSDDDLSQIEPDIVLETKPTTSDPLADDLQDMDMDKGKKRKKTVQCPHCSKTFTHRNSLLYHVRSHSGRRPHQCDVCGKGFFAANALRVHMRMHSGDKPYTCTVCGRNFRQWGDLKYHITSLHSNTKQYQCEFCGKDFARKYSLIVHRRIHTGEKNYVCDFCRKSFRASSYLMNHRRIHTGEKPYNCDVCHKPFRVKSDMKRHRNTHNKTRVETAPVRVENSPETILPDNNDQENLLSGHSLPLNLNMRHDSTDDLTSYSRDALGRENTLYVWIPASGESILPD